MKTQSKIITEEGFELEFRERPSKELKLMLPFDVISSLERVAETRDMSLDALIKMYLGQSLRQDLSKLFAERVLEKTAQVLTRHMDSKEQVTEIISEIRHEAAA